MNFYQRVFLIVLSAALTYAVGCLITNPDAIQINLQKQNDIYAFTKKTLYYDSYENALLNDVILPNNIKTSLRDIHGLREQKKLILRSLFGKNNKIFKNIQNNKGVLIYGPPGTGKTMMAQAIAKDANMPIILFNVTNIENKLLGESNKYVHALFSLANKLSPCVVFIDEIDCVCSTRNEFDQSHVNTLKSVMLTHMDGLLGDGRNNVFVGATNRIGSIDPAFKRRIPVSVEIPIPELDDIRAMLRDNMDVSDDVVTNIAYICLGLSFSDIRQLCQLVGSTYEPHMDIVTCFNDNSKFIHV